MKSPTAHGTFPRGRHWFGARAPEHIVNRLCESRSPSLPGDEAGDDTPLGDPRDASPASTVHRLQAHYILSYPGKLSWDLCQGGRWVRPGLRIPWPNAAIDVPAKLGSCAVYEYYIRSRHLMMFPAVIRQWGSGRSQNLEIASLSREMVLRHLSLIGWRFLKILLDTCYYY